MISDYSSQVHTIVYRGRDHNVWYDLSLVPGATAYAALTRSVGSDLIESDGEPLLWHLVTTIPRGEKSPVSNQERTWRISWPLIVFLMHHKHER